MGLNYYLTRRELHPGNDTTRLAVHVHHSGFPHAPVRGQSGVCAGVCEILMLQYRRQAGRLKCVIVYARTM